MKVLKVLVACEESQAVTIAFRNKGHVAYSCDLLPCSGGHPEWHYKMDAIQMLYSAKWDLVIAHPPCTRLANSGVRWLASKTPREGYEWDIHANVYLREDQIIWRELDKACEFFNEFLSYGHRGNKIAIENPVQHRYAKSEIRDTQTQIIQPWQFGHGESKATCLWLYNIPLLKPTNIVDGREGKVWKMPPGPERAKLRSKTYPGIAKAMADAWG